MNENKYNANQQQIKKKQYLPKELIGRIIDKKQKKVYAKGDYYGTLYYELDIECENKPQIKKISVFPNLLTKEQIWKDIEEVKYYSKKYVFYCQQWMNWYKLLDWKELKEADHV